MIAGNGESICYGRENRTAHGDAMAVWKPGPLLEMTVRVIQAQSTAGMYVLPPARFSNDRKAK